MINAGARILESDADALTITLAVMGRDGVEVEGKLQFKDREAFDAALKKITEQPL